MESFTSQIILLLTDEPSLFDPTLLLPIGLMFVIGYFLLLRPEQRKQTEMQDLLSNLKKNDKVETIGGILGTIVRLRKDKGEVTLRVDDKTGAEMRFNLRAISSVLDKQGGKSANNITDDEPEAEDSDESEST